MESPANSSPAAPLKTPLTEAQKREILRQKRLQKIQSRGNSFLVTADTDVARNINKAVDSTVNSTVSSALHLSDSGIATSSLLSDNSASRLSPSSSSDSLASQDKSTTEILPPTVNNSTHILHQSNFEELETPPDTPSNTSNNNSAPSTVTTPLQLDSVKILHLNPEVQTPNVVGIRDENSITRDIFSPQNLNEAATPLIHQSIDGLKPNSIISSNLSFEAQNPRENSSLPQTNNFITYCNLIVLFIGIFFACVHSLCSLTAHVTSCSISLHTSPIVLFFSMQLVFWFIPKKSSNARQQQDTGFLSILMHYLGILQKIRVSLRQCAIFLLAYMLCSQVILQLYSTK